MRQETKIAHWKAGRRWSRGPAAGRATAIALAQAGADVALVARSAEELECTQEEVSKTGRRALTLPTDLAKVDGAA